MWFIYVKEFAIKSVSQGFSWSYVIESCKVAH